jgi:transcription factor SFP1
LQCRNYTCCGLQLNDLHALVDHFEDRHVLVVDPNAAPASPSFGPSGAFDVDDMELDDGGSSGASTPPPATPLSPRSSPPPGSVFDTSLVRSAYATYGEFNTSLSAGSTPPPEEGRLNAPGCVPPAVLFSPGGSPSGSRTGSPVPRASAAAGPSTEKPAKAAVPRASTTVARPATTLLLSKPFKCPKPNCNKSYKQANGLKYHITHGSCSFAPAKEVTEVNAVLAQRGRAALPADMSASELDLAALGVSEPEAREIEREAERRLKPFACGIADCTRRYKNMNGLRYHYQHSGDHGAIGLALLASGQHECLRNGPHKAGRASSMQHSLSTSSTAASTSTPTTTPASLVPAAMPSIQTAYAAVAAAAASRPYQQYSSPGQVQVPTAQPTSLATHPLLTAYTTGIYAQQQPQLAAPSAAHLA